MKNDNQQTEQTTDNTNQAPTPFNAGLAYSKYKSRQLVFYVAAFTAFLMSSYFMITYFAGDLDVVNWTADQWKHGLASLGVTFVMTGFQVVLYSEGQHGKASALTAFAIFVSVFFAFLTEIGQGMEREEQRVMMRSIESPTYQAMLERIGSLSNAAPVSNPYADDIAKAQMKYNQCLERLAQGKEKHCEGSKGRLEAYQQQADDYAAHASTTRTNTTTALFQEAKGMEKDESNHHPLVKLAQETFGLSSVSSSFIISLLIIGAFEFAFHYLGGKYAQAREALENAGYDVTRKLRQPPRKADGSLETFGTAPVSAFDSIRNTATDVANKTEQAVHDLPQTVGDEFLKAQASRDAMYSKVRDAGAVPSSSYRDKLEGNGVIVPPADVHMDKPASEDVKLSTARMPLPAMLEQINKAVLASGASSKAEVQQAVNRAYLSIENPTPMNKATLQTVAKNISKQMEAQATTPQPNQPDVAHEGKVVNQPDASASVPQPKPAGTGRHNPQLGTQEEQFEMGLQPDVAHEGKVVNQPDASASVPQPKPAGTGRHNPQLGTQEEQFEMGLQPDASASVPQPNQPDVAHEGKVVNQPDASASVPQPNQPDASGSQVDLEQAYQAWIAVLQAGGIKPTLPPTKRWISEKELIKGIKHIQALAVSWLERAKQEGVIMDNPEGGRGKAKYVLTI